MKNYRIAKFDPLQNKNEHLRAEFWDRYADDFVSIGDSLSSQSLQKGEYRLIDEFLRKKRKGGKFLKLDLWNEVHNTHIIDQIWQNYSELHGIDIAPRLVARAKKNLEAKKIPLIARVGDIRKLPYRTNSFDYIFTMGTIEHIPHPIDAMKEIYRVLKPGGRAVIGVPNKYEWFGKSIVLDLLVVLGFKKDGYEKSFSWSGLISDLESCGFVVIKKTGPYFMPWFVRLADWYLYQTSKKFKYFLWLPIVICDNLSKISFLRTYGGSLLAPVVEKPKK
jgi:SAM-dependent methyltransferase